MQLPKGSVIYLSNTVILTTGARQATRELYLVPGHLFWVLPPCVLECQPSLQKSNVLWYNKPSSVWEIWPSACIHQLALNGFWATMFKVVCLCSFSFSFLCNHMLGLRKDTCPLVNVPALSLWSAMRWWVTSQKKTNKWGRTLSFLGTHLRMWFFPETLFHTLL